MMSIIGIDPGSQGGIAWLHDCRLDCVKTAALSGLTRHELIHWLEERKSRCAAVVAYIEKVSSSPQMGVVSAFTFGQNYERVIMACAAAKIPGVDIPPKKWQQVVRLTYKSCWSQVERKRAGKGLAQRLFPGVKVTNATSDALLIARAGCLIEGGAL